MAQPYLASDIMTPCMATCIHESRNLKQARPYGQDVDLLRNRALTTPSRDTVYHKKRKMSRCRSNTFLCCKKDIDFIRLFSIKYGIITLGCDYKINARLRKRERSREHSLLQILLFSCEVADRTLILYEDVCTL